MSAGMADWLRTGRSIHRLDRKALSNHRDRLALLVRKCEVRTNEPGQIARKITGLADTFRMSAFDVCARSTATGGRVAGLTGT
jgi:hypothetical protein